MKLHVPTSALIKGRFFWVEELFSGHISRIRSYNLSSTPGKCNGVMISGDRGGQCIGPIRMQKHPRDFMIIM
jgi:hypothetical protein